MIFGSMGGREKEREHPSFSLRSSEFRRSEFVELRVKVHLLDEGYVYIQKKGGISPKIQRKRFQEIKDFGLGRLPTHATMLQEVGILPIMVYFHHKGLILGTIWCRGPKALFGLFRNCLKPFLWHIWGRFRGSVCKVSMTCSKHGLRAVWMKSLH